MNAAQILEQAFLGEDSRNQFKATVESPDGLAAELCAFGNADGGRLFIGIDDRRQVTGIADRDLERINQLVANVTTHNISPPLFVRTERVKVEDKRVMVVEVPRGGNKPYEAAGGFWVKDGADKRKAKREELLRLFQASGGFFADEMPAGITVEAIARDLFDRFYEEAYGEPAADSGVAFPTLLANLKLATPEGQLTLAGLLLFCHRAHEIRPQFTIKATHYAGSERSGNDFIDKEDIGSALIEQYKNAVAFIRRNLKRIQVEADFNAPGKLEIPETALAEAVANALVHRDYFIQSPVMIDLFEDRLEITSPGKLPNTVNEINIQYGVHIERNPIILTFMQKMKDFKYSGRGSGIPRIIRHCRDAGVAYAFTNDIPGERFTVRFARPLAPSAAASSNTPNALNDQTI